MQRLPQRKGVAGLVEGSQWRIRGPDQGRSCHSPKFFGDFPMCGSVFAVFFLGLTKRGLCQLQHGLLLKQPRKAIESSHIGMSRSLYGGFQWAYPPDHSF